MSILVRVAYAVLALVVSLVVICSLRTVLLSWSRSKPPEPCAPGESEGYFKVNQESWLRFKQALMYKTVSINKYDYDRKELKKLRNFLLETYNCLFQTPVASYEIVNELSLLIHVRGRNSSLLPYLLAAHLDVVPVVQEEWQYNAFDPMETDNGTMMYARGTIDDKGSLIGILEALRFLLLERGLRPERSFYIAFGHDEEVGGRDGAAHIAMELRRLGVKELYFVLDEGTPVLENLFPGLNKQVAGIGVSEKGSMYLNLSVRLEGGHSSMPPKQTSVGVLSAAITRLEENPHEIIFDQLTQDFLEALSPEMSFPLNFALSNLWLFKPIVSRYLIGTVSESLIRTTTAVTMFNGGVKTNVIPPTAWAIVNHRIHPMQTVNEILELDRMTINDDRVVITPMPDNYDPHPISPHDPSEDEQYGIVVKTVTQIYPGSIPGPIALVANTDTKHYLNFTQHVFRHLPFVLDSKTDIPRIHGRDERLSKSNFESAINFYYHLMLNADPNSTQVANHSHSNEL